ncbi:MAG TPA: SCO family protein [Chitinophagaceae bacterium]|nr:SCO family protein [Chitinophagaceae bacterium]
MSRKRVFYFLFFAGLVVAFFMIMSWVIPGFTKKSIPPIGTLEPFSFTTQNGTPFTEKNMQGKVSAVYYFFTTCSGICPRINHNMRTVYEAVKGEKEVLLLAHTCDPEVDSAARLKRYADSMQVDTERWVFLTGRKDSLYTMARQVYKIDDPANNVTDFKSDFLHTQFVALVNKKGTVVKIYDALKPSELKELTADIKKAVKE